MMRVIFSILVIFSLLIFIQGHSPAQNNLLNSYQRLASLYCYIEDYQSWLKRESTLHYLLDLAQYFDISTDRIEQELEQYRLQRECLRVLERLPIIVGGG